MMKKRRRSNSITLEPGPHHLHLQLPPVQSVRYPLWETLEGGTQTAIEREQGESFAGYSDNMKGKFLKKQKGYQHQPEKVILLTWGLKEKPVYCNSLSHWPTQNCTRYVYHFPETSHSWKNRLLVCSTNDPHSSASMKYSGISNPASASIDDLAASSRWSSCCIGATVSW